MSKFFVKNSSISRISLYKELKYISNEMSQDLHLKRKLIASSRLKVMTHYCLSYQDVLKIVPFSRILSNKVLPHLKIKWMWGTVYGRCVYSPNVGIFLNYVQLFKFFYKIHFYEQRKLLIKNTRRVVGLLTSILCKISLVLHSFLF